MFCVSYASTGQRATGSGGAHGAMQREKGEGRTPFARVRLRDRNRADTASGNIYWVVSEGAGTTMMRVLTFLLRMYFSNLTTPSIKANSV